MAKIDSYKKLVFEDDTIRVFNCGCKESKLESPTGKDHVCRTHERFNQ